MVVSTTGILEGGLIEDSDILEESNREHDFLNRDDKIKEYCERIENIGKTGIIGLIGPFGCGKTTFLNQVKLVSSGRWMNFEAWQYPDRKDLWENFILDLAEEYGENIWDDYRKAIAEGESAQIKDILNISKTGVSIIGKILERGTTGFAGVTDVSCGLLDLINAFFKEKPLTKIYELQGLLYELLNQFLETEDILYIVIEDIDRSGESGLYFLETLNLFLKKNFSESDKKIVVITPISDTNFVKNKSSYLKTLDYYHFFPIKNYNLSNFISEVFVNDILNVLDSFGGILTELINEIFKKYPRDVNMRYFKSILRMLNQDYMMFIEEEGVEKWLDYRVFIITGLARYFYRTNNNTNEPLYQLNREYVITGESPYGPVDCFTNALIKVLKGYSGNEYFYSIRFGKTEELYETKSSSLRNHNAYLINDRYLYGNNIGVNFL